MWLFVYGCDVWLFVYFWLPTSLSVRTFNTETVLKSRDEHSKLDLPAHRVSVEAGLLSLQYSTLYGLSTWSLDSDSTKAYFTQDFPEAETTMETYV